ncbi:ATP-grasp domain-containing protein [Pseudonocardia sp. TRM90224]|uniref:ATP-grasp domain-containing protein n=1 Tax=Pseudonocardia sp. TRM90224 TaxID=2812678 RepID=UPI001E2A4E0F|nr:ATP-grasp domain-containing protein [Pseudonocardia sp. TRM90224]
MPRILVVGGGVEHVRKARELGLDVVLVEFPDAYDPAYAPLVDQALLVDYGDVDRLLPLVRALHETHPIQAAVSLFELGLLPAARINEALGLGGESLETAETVELLLDKWRMRRHLATHGVSPMASAVGRSVHDIHEFGKTYGFPIIVKPVRESGSLGVFRINDRADVDAVADRFRALGNRSWAPGDLSSAESFDEFLIEEFLDGPEISVETLSFDGRHVVVATTDKAIGPGFVEIGHSQPSSFPAGTLREAIQLVADFLDAVGLRNGPAHTEVKLTGRGPRIVESHNRIGGDRINELARIVYGVDMERYALGAPFGLVEPLVTAPVPRAGAAIRFLTPQPGRVVDVAGVDAVRADPALAELRLAVEPGAEIPPLTWNEDKIGHVIARGATAADAVAHAEQLAAEIRIRTEPAA